MNILELKKINKYFYKHHGWRFNQEKHHILEDISFSLKENQVIGLIGKNGSGKSTLLKLIAGLIAEDSGYIDIKFNQASLVNSNPRSFYWRLTCNENLLFFGGLNGSTNTEITERIAYYSEVFHIHNFLDLPFRFLSSGQMQVMSLIRSLILEPKILLLDEPTVNLDYEYRDLYVNTVLNYKDCNKAGVIWCSHDLNEVEKVSNKIALLDNKKIKFFGDNDHDLSNNKSCNFKIEILKNELHKIKEIKMKFKKIKNFLSDDKIFINFYENNECVSTLLKKIFEKGIHIYSVVPVKPKTSIDGMFQP